MTREHATADVFAASVPANVDPNDNTQFTQLIGYLDIIAKAYVHKQWEGAHERPTAIKHLVSDWTVTDKPEEVEEFQPAHDCAACRAGNDQAMTYLREHPGRWVALANLHYIEVWDS